MEYSNLRAQGDGIQELICPLLRWEPHVWLGSRSGLDSGYVNLNALGFGIQTHLFLMTLVLILTPGCSPFPSLEREMLPIFTSSGLICSSFQEQVIFKRFFSVLFLILYDNCLPVTSAKSFECLDHLVTFLWEVPVIPLSLWRLLHWFFKVLRSYREVLSPLVTASVVWETEEHPHGVFLSNKLSWIAVQNWFLGLPKTVVNFKALQFPGFSSSPFEDRQHNRASQPSCAAAFFKGRRHPLVSILAFSHFISPQNSQMNTIRLWWFTALEFLKLLYNFLLRDFNLYKGHTLIFFAKCLWHRNFYTTLSSRHDARDSFNSSACLLHSSPDPLYMDLWGSLGRFGA